MKDEVLYAAWKNLNRKTKGTGLDSLTIQQVEASGVESFIRSVKKKLKTEKYAADEVKRVEVLKRNGETRKLGILTLKDRLVQGAVKLILEPILKLISKTVPTATVLTGLQNSPVLRYTNGWKPEAHIT